MKYVVKSEISWERGEHTSSGRAETAADAAAEAAVRPRIVVRL